jgi:murein DD-endopeptidase MepM/ murein hydrolase activator NlpD
MRVLSDSWRLLNERSASLESGLRAVGSEVETIVGQHAALKRERDTLAARVHDLETRLRAEQIARARDVEAEKQARIRDVEAEKQARARELDAGDSRYQEKAGIAEERRRQLATTAQERDALARERAELGLRLAALTEEVDSMRGSQRLLIDRVWQHTAKGLDETERAIAATGLNVDRLIAGVPGDAQGGPLIAIKATGEASAEINARLAQLHARAERWRRLQAVLPRLPLASPLDQYKLTSTFGGRRDPFTGGWSAHNGLDFQNAVGTPVHTTAPGKVVFAGWRGGYGWLVEIDHGHGIRTRYAHMQQLTVEEGQTVKLRQKIGTLGSSGRSSGPHLHYEVVVDGKPVDPQNFLTAGRHVQSR